jgi:hypothetical protein
MDADDVSLPQRLSKQVRFLDRNRRVGLISCSFVWTDQEGNDLGVHPLWTRDCEIVPVLLKWNCFCHGAAMFRRGCLAQVGLYREQFEFAQDYDLFLRIAERDEVANLREVLYKRRIGPTMISVVEGGAQDEYVRFAVELAHERFTSGVDRLGAALSPSHLGPWQRRRARSRVAFSWAAELYGHGRKSQAVSVLVRSILNDPFSYRLWMFAAWRLARSVVTRKRTAPVASGVQLLEKYREARAGRRSEPSSEEQPREGTPASGF